jgi:glutathione S-transferase
VGFLVHDTCCLPDLNLTSHAFSSLWTAANSHGPLAIVNKLKLDVTIENAYGKTRSPEFLEMNPCHCAPTLQFDDGSAMWESCAIMRYLVVNLDTENVLYPADAKLRGRIDMVMDWRQTSLYPCLPDIGYVVFGMDCSDEGAKKSFAKLMDEHFKTLTDVFLKDTPFCYSDEPTIADLAVAPCLTFIKARAKFWEAVPGKVKQYYERVLEAFPETKENFDMLDGMCSGYEDKGKDLEPSFEA